MSLNGFLLFLLVVSFVKATAELTSFSARCEDDLETYWYNNICRRCDKDYSIRAGHEFAPNCGMDDLGSQHIPMYVLCPNGTHNNGSTSKCQPCTICPSNWETRMPCSATMDAQCYEVGETATNGESHQVTTQAFETSLELQTVLRIISPAGSTEAKYINHKSFQTINVQWHQSSNTITGMPNPEQIVCIVLPVTLLLCLISIYILYSVKRKKGGLYVSNTAEKRKKQYTEVHRMEKTLSANDIRYLPPHNNKQLHDILAPGIKSAPLWTVLDNLDVLEELIMLLDPECTAAKTTRHVAAQCSFSATWINYIYSMRNTKSPLKAVLEGITTKFPEWTVGDLAKVFADIGRGDAVAVLAKLPERETI